MSPVATDQFTQCVQDFAWALARETSRLEEAERAKSIQHAEITATMVVKANDQVRNPEAETPAPVPLRPFVAQLVAFPTTISVGILGVT
jgi:hypothetical protein